MGQENTQVAEQPDYRDLPILDGGEFLRGQRDCQAGIPHKPGQSNDYNRGYSAQYTAEQIKSERN